MGNESFYHGRYTQADLDRKINLLLQFKDNLSELTKDKPIRVAVTFADTLRKTASSIQEIYNELNSANLLKASQYVDKLVTARELEDELSNWIFFTLYDDIISNFDEINEIAEMGASLGNSRSEIAREYLHAINKMLEIYCPQKRKNRVKPVTDAEIQFQRNMHSYLNRYLNQSR